VIINQNPAEFGFNASSPGIGAHRRKIG